MRQNQNREREKKIGKIEVKSGNLIIHGGISENLVSNEVIHKLELKCALLLEGYRVSWLQNGNRVTVREQCLINFNI